MNTNNQHSAFTKTPLALAVQTLFFAGLVSLLPPSANASGFEAKSKADVVLEDFECEDCPTFALEDYSLEFSLAYLDEQASRYEKFSGLEDGVNLLLSGQFFFREESGYYWKTDFHNLGLDSGGLNLELGDSQNYRLGLSYQKIPLSDQSNLMSAFNQSGNYLDLNSGFQRADTTFDMTDTDGYQAIDLKVDWQTIGLTFEYQTDSNLSYEIDYRELNKEGHREFSVAQMLSAAFIPLPIDNTTQDLNANISWFNDQLFISFDALLSWFNNDINSVTVAFPFTSLVSGSDRAQLALDPQNTFSQYSLNLRYRYANRSHFKMRYSNGQMSQDEPLVEYSTNPMFRFDLPTQSMNAEINTSDLYLQLLHQITDDWSVNIKYRERERDNDTAVYQWQRLITDLYVSGSIANVPYDYYTETLSATLSFNLSMAHRMNVRFNRLDKERTLQQVSNNSEEGYEINYHGIFDDLVLHVRSEQSHRNSSEKTLIDYLAVTENPLLSRYNVAERDHGAHRISAGYALNEEINLSVIASVSNQDYQSTEIGLTENNQQNLGLDLGWQLSDSAYLSFYYQDQKLDTSLAGSNQFALADWFADSTDEIQSLGLDVRFTELNDTDMSLTMSINQSDAVSNVTMTQLASSNALPEISSDWTQASIELKYPWSEHLDILVKYDYQDFNSEDYALTDTLPGDVYRLLTLGNLNDQYQLNIFRLSAVYRF